MQVNQAQEDEGDCAPHKKEGTYQFSIYLLTICFFLLSVESSFIAKIFVCNQQESKSHPPSNEPS